MSGTAKQSENSPASPSKLECTSAVDSEPETEVLFNTDETRSIIDHGIAAAVEEFQRRYNEKLAALNARLEASEAENKKLNHRLDAVLAENESHKMATDSRIKKLEKSVTELREQNKKQDQWLNDLEQYSRRSHIRIRGLHIKQNETCKAAVVRLCSTKLGINITEDDLDAAHPLPKPAPRPQTQDQQATRLKTPDAVPNPVIVRFHRRDQRDAVIKARSALANSKIVISEDLTAANQKLLHHLYKATTVTSAWSWKGKILYTLTGESKKTHRISIHDEIPA